MAHARSNGARSRGDATNSSDNTTYWAVIAAITRTQWSRQYLDRPTSPSTVVRWRLGRVSGNSPRRLPSIRWAWIAAFGSKKHA